MNGVNLNQFQFEYDLTWMAFFQNAEGRTYTRYGGREDHDAESHLNKKSLLRVMRQVLILHEDQRVQPDNRYEPIAKSLRTPEDIPPMKRMLSKRKEKCIHCHDVKAAGLRHDRELDQLDKNLVFTYPSPSRLGIRLDPEIQFKVRIVEENSPAKIAGIRAGDLIRTIDRQRVLTFADATRVLELAPETGKLQFDLERGGKTVAASLQLPKGWRKNDDPSWRSTTGSVGPLSGIWGKRANQQQRKQLGLNADTLAMRVTYIWAPWARKAGIKFGDTIVSVDGYKADMTIRQFQAYLHLNRNWGDKISVVVRRGRQDVKLTFQFPDKPPN
ncbi:MAG: PDZ domain-containing protein [Planctomycetes bacterium]|nr:PDZ domain-containing protein [Planctomycetota bacterium]